ncbi:MAG: DUF1638 domain-containing protein [Synergistaceae bacterium]|jgi:hypothetical protein|nr:DUF1638 domain-containing protein [Synergistaceae bacterium]
MRAAARTKILACEVMKKELEKIAREKNLNADISFIELGLHLVPKKLHNKLQEALDTCSGYDRVILAFGLCGGSASGIRNGCASLIIPKFHDCVPILLGSLVQFERYQKEEPGTYYLCRGWVEGGQGILHEYEAWRDKYGEEKAKKLQKIMYANYRRLIYIHSPVACGTDLRSHAGESARMLNLEYGETVGDLGIMEKILAGPWDDPDLFVNISPHGVVTEEHFGI